MKKSIKEELGTNNIEKRIVKKPSAAIAKIESSLIEGAVDYMRSANYQQIIIPHMTKATGACENFSTLFKSDLFGEAIYLNQTGQLMLEAFMHEFEKTYCWGPSFRKELKADNRHLIEFPLFEIEVANHNLESLKSEISNIFTSMIENVEKTCSKELEYLLDDANLGKLKPPYNSITYREAIEKLEDYGLEFGDDLKSEHEAKIVELNDGKPLFVTHYPKEIKFFNMRTNRSDPTIVNSMDLLMPYSGETVGAAEREENHEILRERLRTSDMLRLLKDAIRKEDKFKEKIFTEEELYEEANKRFSWYMDVIKEHPIPHAGCGIGMSRVTQSILKTDDIRYATAFPINRETLF